MAYLFIINTFLLLCDTVGQIYAKINEIQWTDYAISVRKAISNYEIKNSNCINFLQLLKGKYTHMNNLSKCIFIPFFVLSPLKTESQP